MDQSTRLMLLSVASSALPSPGEMLITTAFAVLAKADSKLPNRAYVCFCVVPLLKVSSHFVAIVFNGCSCFVTFLVLFWAFSIEHEAVNSRSRSQCFTYTERILKRWNGIQS